MHRNVRQWIVSANYTHPRDAILHEVTNRGGGGSCRCNLHEVENMFLATLRPDLHGSPHLPMLECFGTCLNHFFKLLLILR